ncbi:adenosylmethionine decarboxylase [Candidatus Woesearchaeota archaeon]|nr:adenosylmethionine decarboxylase [Candidatus Woesearchaeota archaeon]
MIGTHHLLDLYSVDSHSLTDLELIRDALRGACAAGHFTTLSEHIHTFPEGGITAILLLAESHISIHTYPEHRYAAIDLFSCGAQARPEAAIQHLITALAPAHHTRSVSTRGEGICARPLPAHIYNS